MADAIRKFELERFDVHEDYDNEFLRLIQKEHLFRYSAAREFLQRVGQRPLRILDAASGHGYGYEYLQDLGSYTGIDRSEVALDSARRLHPGADYRQGDLQQKATFEGIGSVDVIVSFETVEHLPDPDLFCRYCFEALKRGQGYFVFSAPTVLTRDFDAFHLHDRSAEGWRHTALRSGFTILEEKALGFEVPFHEFASSTPNNPEQRQIIVRFLMTHPHYLISRIKDWVIRRKFVWGNQMYFCQAR
jgi:2-polyprenyl-3-methyl-5-hydroxy-6-metoxy-1,4-benzoquinol methylase